MSIYYFSEAKTPVTKKRNTQSSVETDVEMAPALIKIMFPIVLIQY